MKNEKKKIEEQRVQELIKDVIDDFHKRQYERKSFDTTWQMNMNFLLGNQYCGIGYGGAVEETDKQYFWQEREVFNHIAPIYDIRFAKLSKIKPKMSVIPSTTDERDIKTAKMSKKILSSVYNKMSVGEKINDALKWSEVCGTSFYKVVWNRNQGQVVGLDEDGREIRSGEVEISVCSPFEIYPDNMSAQSFEECQSVIHAKAYSVNDIKDIFGVEVDGQDIKTFTLNNVFSGLGGLGYNATATKITQNTKSNSAIVIERYEKPSKEFPNGRLVIVAGDKLVFEGELPYLNGVDGKRDFPFIRQISFEIPGCFWGSSFIERLIPVQRAYNAVKNRKHEFINRLSMGILSVEDGSVDIDNLEEEGLCPGKVLVYRQGSDKPEYLSAESIPNGLSDEEEKLLQEFSKISGVTEVLDSNYVSSNMSGVALELLIGQDEARLNMSSESLKSAVKVVAQKILRLYKQFAIFPRLARIVGENGKVEMFYFSSSDVSSDDVVIDAQSEIGETLSQRREMLFTLLDKGLLFNEKGELSNRAKAKFLDMLGLGVWENGQDLHELQLGKAEEENLKMLDGVSVKVSEIDDNDIHYSTHVAFMLGKDYEKAKASNPKLEEIFLEHIREHKRLKQEN